MRKQSIMHIFVISGLILVLLTPVLRAQELDYRLQKNLYIVFDGSGSMRSSNCSGSQSKLDVAKDAFAAFLSTIPEDMNCGLYIFDKNGSREVQPLQRLDRIQLAAVISAVDGGGSTPLSDAIIQARESLLGQKEKQLGYGEFMLLIITDGEANQVSRLPSVVKPVSDEGIIVQVIGFCLDGSHSLKWMVNKYREANSPEELKIALSKVLGEADSFPALTEFDYELIDSVDLESLSSEKTSADEGTKSEFPIANYVGIFVVILIVIKIRRKKSKKRR